MPPIDKFQEYSGLSGESLPQCRGCAAQCPPFWPFLQSRSLGPVLSNPLPHPREDYVRAHYTKYEYRIPMRDGKRLFTAVYVPKDVVRLALSHSSWTARLIALRPYGEDQYPAASWPLRRV